MDRSVPKEGQDKGGTGGFEKELEGVDVLGLEMFLAITVALFCLSLVIRSSLSNLLDNWLLRGERYENSTIDLSNIHFLYKM